MRIGVAIVAETSLSVDETTYFETRIESGGVALPGSHGCDRFGVNAMIIPGKRVAATGRTARYGPESTPTGIGFGALEASPPQPCEIEAAAAGSLTFVVENNAVLDPGVFCMDFSLAATVYTEDGPRHYDIMLRRPDITLDWPARGVFRFDISRALAG